MTKSEVNFLRLNFNRRTPLKRKNLADLVRKSTEMDNETSVVSAESQILKIGVSKFNNNKALLKEQPDFAFVFAKNVDVSEDKKFIAPSATNINRKKEGFRNKARITKKAQNQGCLEINIIQKMINRILDEQKMSQKNLAEILSITEKELTQLMHGRKADILISRVNLPLIGLYCETDFYDKYRHEDRDSILYR